MAPASCTSILWQNESKSVVLLDLPRSIEEAQLPSSELRADDGRDGRAESDGRPQTRLRRRLVSALPPAAPFPTPEPKAGGSEPSAASPSAQLTELMTQAAVEAALDLIKQSHDGPWCLPRITCRPPPPPTKPGAVNPPPPPLPPTPGLTTGAAAETPGPSLEAPPEPPRPPVPNPALYHLPPNSHPLPATISSTTTTTTSPTPFPPTAPKQFNLILLDPPWPNRSAKRKRTGPGSYHPAPDLSSIRAVLGHVPVASRLAPGGLVAVWVTNAARFADLLTRPNSGVFAAWDVELVGEWTWLKVTAAGEPVVGVESRWRKPWERLLIARKRGGSPGGGPVEGKVIVSVPDVHSRKPNLRGLFEDGLLPERYEAMEVFARNLTAGWWAWGDEVLLFQRKECWVEQDDGEDEEE